MQAPESACDGDASRAHHSILRELRFSCFLSNRRELATVVCDRSVSANVRSDFGVFCMRLSLPAKSRFPAGETDLNGDLVRPRHLLLWKAKYFVLPGPLQGKVSKPSHSYSMWQSTLDGRLDEIGCKERQRDHHVDLSGAAPFPFCNGLGTRCCINDQFIEPATTTRNRGDECCARLIPAVIIDAVGVVLSLEEGDATTRFHHRNWWISRCVAAHRARSRASPSLCGASPCSCPRTRTIPKRKAATRRFCRACSNWVGRSGKTSKLTTGGPEVVLTTPAKTQQN